MDATAQNAGIEYSATARRRSTIFSFQIDATPLTRSGYVLDRRLNKMVQQVTLTNNTGAAILGPINLALDSLSGNTALFNASGTTANNAPLGSAYITMQAGNLAPGATVSTTLQFNKPVSGSITYTPAHHHGHGKSLTSSPDAGPGESALPAQAAENPSQQLI